MTRYEQAERICCGGAVPVMKYRAHYKPQRNAAVAASPAHGSRRAENYAGCGTNSLETAIRKPDSSIELVGMRGFEPPTPASRTRYTPHYTCTGFSENQEVIVTRDAIKRNKAHLNTRPFGADLAQKSRPVNLSRGSCNNLAQEPEAETWCATKCEYR